MAVATEAARARAAAARGTPLRPVDLLLAGYVAVVSLVAVIRAPEQPGCWWLLAAHALFGLLLYLVTRPGLGPVGRTIRELYPLLLLVGLYSELDVLNGAGGIQVYDATVQQWELAVFGVQISAEWWRAMPSRLWSAVLHAAYLSYYVVVVAPAFYFVWRRDLDALRHFVLVVMTTTTPWPPAARMVRHSPAPTSRRRSPPRSRPPGARGNSPGRSHSPPCCSQSR
jgi:hypothetical protein